MKNQLEKIIQDKKDLLKLDSSKNGLRLDWVNENNYSVYFKGVKYTPDNFSDLTFIDSVLEGKELSNDKRIEKLFKKQAKDALKKEEYDAQNGKGSKQNDEGKKDDDFRHAGIQWQTEHEICIKIKEDENRAAGFALKLTDNTSDLRPIVNRIVAHWTGGEMR